MIKLYFWGTGQIAEWFFIHAPLEMAAGFIDSSEKKIGTTFHGKGIISFDDYLRFHRDAYIVISCMMYAEILNKLKCNNITKYFLVSDFPGEWFEPYVRDEYEQFLDESLTCKEGRTAVIGCSLFSIYVANRIKEKSGMYPKMLYCKREYDELVIELEQDIPGLEFKYFDEDNELYEVIYNTDRDLKNSVINKFYKIIEIRDCSKSIISYKNPKIESFCNKYQGKRCFVVGNAPSLKISDLETIYAHHEFSFGVNYINRIFDKTRWRPDFYFMEDAANLVSLGTDFFLTMDTKYVFLPDTIGENKKAELERQLRNSFFWFHNIRDMCLDCTPEYSEDVSWGAYYGGTVLYKCIQFATYMGFCEVILIGVDLPQGNGEINRYTHFYDEKEDVFYAPYVYNAYKAAREYAEKNGIRIINASRGGKMKCFELTDFDSLF